MTREGLYEKILRESYSVQYKEIGVLGAALEMRRKNKSGTPFIVHRLPTTAIDGNMDFYFPSRHLPIDDILKQFESL